MSFGSLESGDDNAPLAEINMVPLIDVMLVLLVIFLVTSPLLTNAVKVDLPKASSAPTNAKPEHIQVAIDAQGVVYWNKEAVDAATLTARLESAAHQSTQPELHIHADGKTPYEAVAQLMSQAARHGIGKIGFITKKD